MHTYLSLFKDISRAEGLFGHCPEGDVGTPTLAWLYARALNADAGRRFDAYRHLGDVALLIAGLFRPYLCRQKALVGVDYHIKMGAGCLCKCSKYRLPHGILCHPQRTCA